MKRKLKKDKKKTRRKIKARKLKGDQIKLKKKIKNKNDCEVNKKKNTEQKKKR